MGIFRSGLKLFNSIIRADVQKQRLRVLIKARCVREARSRRGKIRERQDQGEARTGRGKIKERETYAPAEDHLSLSFLPLPSPTLSCSRRQLILLLSSHLALRS